MLDEDGSPVLLLSDHAMDSCVGEVSYMTCKGVR